MSSPRAYELAKVGNPHVEKFFPELLAQGKLHPLVSYEYRKGPGTLKVGLLRGQNYRVDVFWLDEETNEVFKDTGFVCTKEDAALRHLEKQREKYKNGPLKR